MYSVTRWIVVPLIQLVVERVWLESQQNHNVINMSRRDSTSEQEEGEEEDTSFEMEASLIAPPPENPRETAQLQAIIGPDLTIRNESPQAAPYSSRKVYKKPSAYTPPQGIPQLPKLAHGGRYLKESLNNLDILKDVPNSEEEDAELGHFKNPDADDVIKHHNMLTKRKNRVGALSKGYLERHFKGAKALDSSSPNYLSSLILADTRRDPERPWEYNSEDEKEGSDDEEHLKGDSFFLLSMRERPTLLPNQGKVVFPTVRKRMYDLCQTGM